MREPLSDLPDSPARPGLIPVRAEGDHFAVGEDYGEFQDVVYRSAMDDRIGPAGVVGDHPSEGCPAGGGHVGGELKSVRSQVSVEFVEDHPGLDLDGPGFKINATDVVHVA